MMPIVGDTYTPVKYYFWIIKLFFFHVLATPCRFAALPTPFPKLLQAT